MLAVASSMMEPSLADEPDLLAEFRERNRTSSLLLDAEENFSFKKVGKDLLRRDLHTTIFK